VGSGVAVVVGLGVGVGREVTVGEGVGESEGEGIGVTNGAPSITRDKTCTLCEEESGNATAGEKRQAAMHKNKPSHTIRLVNTPQYPY